MQKFYFERTNKISAINFYFETTTSHHSSNQILYSLDWCIDTKKTPKNTQKMNKNLFLQYLNPDFDYEILILLILILGGTAAYLIISNCTANPTNNTEALTNEEIETIINESMVTVSNANTDDIITDSDFDTEVESDNSSGFDSDSSSEDEDVLDVRDLFFMPNVDLTVCSIEELKFFEFCSLYAREIEEHHITDEDIMDFLSWFPQEYLFTNWINAVFLSVILII